MGILPHVAEPETLPPFPLPSSPAAPRWDLWSSASEKSRGWNEEVLLGGDWASTSAKSFERDIPPRQQGQGPYLHIQAWQAWSPLQLSLGPDCFRHWELFCGTAGFGEAQHGSGWGKAGRKRMGEGAA